ncbi:MAG: NTP transferase domain-containing protein, partial [Candidatus Binatia bacterium]
MTQNRWGIQRGEAVALPFGRYNLIAIKIDMVSGIVLAAGEARRMGQQKLLLDFNGRPILWWVLEAVLASDL